MMMAPAAYLYDIKDYSMEQLQHERDKLIRSMRHYEKKLMNNPGDERWQICPSPNVVYSVELDYLIEVLELMKQRGMGEQESWMSNR